MGALAGHVAARGARRVILGDVRGTVRPGSLKVGTPAPVPVPWQGMDTSCTMVLQQRRRQPMDGDDTSRTPDDSTAEGGPHQLEEASAAQVRDVSEAAEQEAGRDIDQLATGLDRAREQPGYGREGQ